MPSHSSLRSANNGVSPLARAASLLGESCASKPTASSRLDKIARLAIRIIPVNHSFLHHEENFFRLSNILQRIARNHHNISKLAGLERTQSVLEAQQLGIH